MHPSAILRLVRGADQHKNTYFFVICTSPIKETARVRVRDSWHLVIKFRVSSGVFSHVTDLLCLQPHCYHLSSRGQIAFLSSHILNSTMLFQEIAYSVSSVTFVGGIVAMFWFVMWKYVFEPNPLIRDFFDLDRRQRVHHTANKR